MYFQYCALWQQSFHVLIRSGGKGHERFQIWYFYWSLSEWFAAAGIAVKDHRLSKGFTVVTVNLMNTSRRWHYSADRTFKSKMGTCPNKTTRIYGGDSEFDEHIQEMTLFGWQDVQIQDGNMSKQDHKDLRWWQWIWWTHPGDDTIRLTGRSNPRWEHVQTRPQGFTVVTVNLMNTSRRWHYSADGTFKSKMGTCPNKTTRIYGGDSKFDENIQEMTLFGWRDVQIQDGNMSKQDHRLNKGFMVVTVNLMKTSRSWPYSDDRTFKSKMGTCPNKTIDLIKDLWWWQ